MRAKFVLAARATALDSDAMLVGRTTISATASPLAISWDNNALDSASKINSFPFRASFSNCFSAGLVTLWFPIPALAI
tara:strand:- start:540 stop:773 length:234 start_codon:yes stop_codon:yes gene_type:complete